MESIAYYQIIIIKSRLKNVHIIQYILLTMQTQFALVINTLEIMQMRLEKRLHMLHLVTPLQAAKGKGLATRPPTHWSKSGLVLIAPVFAWSWVCPRPERISIPYCHIIDNNTQGRILLNFSFL